MPLLRALQPLLLLKKFLMSRLSRAAGGALPLPWAVRLGGPGQLETGAPQGACLLGPRASGACWGDAGVAGSRAHQLAGG